MVVKTVNAGQNRPRATAAHENDSPSYTARGALRSAELVARV
jgi:hypothetical protein